ncbi:MAG: tetratricopeptide repeat protein [Solibacillus sp.]
MKSLDHYVEIATRQFTDRQKPRDLFEESIKNLHQSKLITYYGIGGIGKTRLLSFLEQEAPKFVLDPICFSIDFKESYFRNIGEFLNALKSQILANEKINFYSFDIAYSIYFARTQPGEMLLEKSKTIVQDGHILFDVINNLEGIPYANLIPKAINLMSQIPASTKKAIWWKETGKTLVAQLNAIQDIQTLRDILVQLWVKDVTDHFQKQQRKIVFFFDSFECVDLNHLPRIKTLPYQFSEYPALFVIGSRDKLNWPSTEHLIVDEHLVGELSAPDIRSFLQSCGMKCTGSHCSCQDRLEGDSEQKQKACTAIHDEIINKITKVTNGIPVYLDLMVDTYIQIKKTKMPKPEHFTDKRNEVVQLLLEHFTEQDFAVLELLSFPNYWNFSIVKCLLNEYNTGVRHSQMSRFYVYSFIQNDDEQHITLQGFVRKWLQDKAKNNAKDFYVDVHLTLFNHYKELFKKQVTQHFFGETAYHAEHALNLTDFEEWLKKALIQMQNKGNTEDIIAYLQPKIDQDVFSIQACSTFYSILLNCYSQLGNYEEITKQAVNALNIANQAIDTRSQARIQFLLGTAYYAVSEYEEAIKYFKFSITNEENILQSIEAYMKIGKISVTIDDYETAKTNYLQASKRINELLQTEPNNTELNSLAGQCYEKLGELMAYFNFQNEQLRLYKQSIHYLSLAIADEQHPQYLHNVTLLGFSTKRLAEALELQNGDAIGSFKEAIEWYEQVLTVSPFYVDTQEKLGHACADLMRVAYEKKQVLDLKTAFNKADQAFRTVITASPNQGSSLNRLSSIHLEMAKYAMDQFEYSKAKAYLEEARFFNEQTIIRAPKYAYAAAKKQAIEDATTRYNKAIMDIKLD